MNLRRVALVVAVTVWAVTVPAGPAQAALNDATRSLLSKLTVAPESNSATYNRDLFNRWIDVDSDSPERAPRY